MSKHFIKHILWLLPFISFLAGYQVVAYLYAVESLETPTVIGKTLPDALSILTTHNLNPRLQATKEVPDLPAGTILSQLPSPQTKIKPNQNIYLVISHKTQLYSAPSLINKHITDVTSLLKAAGIKHKIYYLPSNHPKNNCFSQYPCTGEQLKDTTMIIYVSTGNNKPVLMPTFKGKSVPAVLESIATHPITPSIVHTAEQAAGHVCNEQCIVVDQRPLAGSTIMLEDNKPLHVQLQVG